MQPGIQVKLNQDEMKCLQLLDFKPRQSGHGESMRSEYKGYYFTWYPSPIRKEPSNPLDDEVSTWEVTDHVYYITMSEKDLPIFRTPTVLTAAEIVRYQIQQDGRSARPDLQGLSFNVKFLGTDKYEVTMFGR